MGWTKRLVIAIFFVCPMLTADGVEIFVPDDYASIQSAINAAAAGDTVIVRPGIWRENIDFLGKAITVTSDRGSDVTVINGLQSGSVVTFQNGENTDSILEGFMIFNGDADLGGGVLCQQASPTILNNHFTGNHAINGAAIGCFDSFSVISDNTIESNQANRGAGIYCQKGAVLISNNLITSNTAEHSGGAISCHEAADATVTGNRIAANNAYRGAGIDSFRSSPIVAGNMIFRNTASHRGGGMCCRESTAPALVNNTLFANTALEGGGLCVNNKCSVSVINTIFWNNTATEGVQIHIGNDYLPYQNSLTIKHSLVEDRQNGIFIGHGCTVYAGPGMIDSDPHFVEPVIDDLHLAYTSPCKDSGDKDAVGLPQEDFEGDPRIADGEVDIGADEFHRHLYYTGPVVPGDQVMIKLIGLPGSGAILAEGSGLLNPPKPTSYGTLYIRMPAVRYLLKDIPSHGICAVHADVPTTWTTGERYPFQALIGGELMLTNLMIVTVD